MNDLDHLAWEPYDRHWIRLRGPWEVSWLEPPLEESELRELPQGRVHLPVDWQSLFGRRNGTARFTRRFQKPTNLDAEERVLITLCEPGCDVRLELNEIALAPLDALVGDPASSPCEDAVSFDITSLLAQTNRLQIDVTVGNQCDGGKPCGLWRPVMLEVITPD